MECRIESSQHGSFYPPHTDHKQSGGRIKENCKKKNGANALKGTVYTWRSTHWCKLSQIANLYHIPKGVISLLAR